VQDAAYSTLLRERRRRLHSQIAEVLETQFPEIAESQPELLARHYTEAGAIERAAGFWGKAGQRFASAIVALKSNAVHSSARRVAAGGPARAQRAKDATVNRLIEAPDNQKTDSRNHADGKRPWSAFWRNRSGLN